MKTTNRWAEVVGRGWAATVFLFTILVVAAGCGSDRNVLEDGADGPQMVANPASLRMGVAKVMKTDLVFEGAGFEATEKVMVVVSGAAGGNRQVVVPLGYGKTGPDGRFSIAVEKKMKIFNLLNADVVFGEKGAIVIVSGPPLPPGPYTATATGYTSNITATCGLTLAPPSFLDRAKDRIAMMLGKIETE